MDTSVGVRELEESAPELVKRAERGEKIVITRHGKPVAVLGPPPLESGIGETSKGRAWKRERAAFERMLPKLTKQHASFGTFRSCSGRSLGGSCT